MIKEYFAKVVLILLSINLLFNVPLMAKESSDYTDQCIKCHFENNLMPEHYSKEDIHWQKGLSCAGCHGGQPNEVDEEKAMSKINGFVGIPSRIDVPNFCGKCHSSIEKMRLFQARIPTDQVTQYYSSEHGKKLKNGEKNVAICTDCHTIHSILPASDTRSSTHAFNLPLICDNCHGNSQLMSKHDLGSNQFLEYSQGVHGVALLENQDLGAPACNDCHGNHGAKPPGVQSISHVCGSCHVNSMNYFNNSSKAEIFSEMGINACEQCHGYHNIKHPDDEMLNEANSSVCSECHSEGEDGFQTANLIYNELKTLSILYDSVKNKSEAINIMGMNNSEIQFALQNIKQNLIHSRTLIHSFDTSKVFEQTREGKLNAYSAFKLAGKEESDYFERRLGYGISTLLLVLLAAALFWKIKSLKN